MYGAEHGAVCANLTYQMKKYLEEHPIGVCFGAGTGFCLTQEPLVVRMPDVAIVRNEHIPKEGIPADFFPRAPDVAVIVISPTDKFDAISAGVHDFFAAGTRRVWIIRPRVRMITIHRADQDVQIIAETQRLLGEDVLPGLEIPATKIFT